jgi:hypothetical protein
MGNPFGVKEGTPYARWPTEALRKLRAALGRHRRLSADQQKLDAEAQEHIKERERSGVDYKNDGALSHPV